MNSAVPPYTVLFTADAKRDVQSLDGSIRKKLRKALEKKLATHPAQYGEPLVGVLKGFWSHHFAAHRVIYRICEDRQFVLVCAVGTRCAAHMSDVYRQFEALVETGRTAQQILDALRSASRGKA